MNEKKLYPKKILVVSNKNSTSLFLARYLDENLYDYSFVGYNDFVDYDYDKTNACVIYNLTENDNNNANLKMFIEKNLYTPIMILHDSKIDFDYFSPNEQQKVSWIEKPLRWHKLNELMPIFENQGKLKESSYKTEKKNHLNIFVELFKKMKNGCIILEVIENEIYIRDYNDSVTILEGVVSGGQILGETFELLSETKLREDIIKVFKTNCKISDIYINSTRNNIIRNGHLFKINNSNIIVFIYTDIIPDDEAMIRINLEKDNLIYQLGASKDRAEEMSEILNHYSIELENINNELKDSNLEIRKIQNQMLVQEKLASIGQLAAGIAHEINNPVGFIASNLRTLRNYFEDFISILDNIEFDSDYNNLKKKLDKIDYLFIKNDTFEALKESLEGTDRILEIVNSLKNYAYSEINSNYSLIDINKNIEQSLKLLGNELKYGIKIKKKLGDVDTVLANSNQISQVLTNIIVNASHAMKSMDREGLLEIESKNIGDFVEVIIKDNGCGISQENLKKIYDPFFTTKEAGKGTGLGLNISYDIIVNKHKGHIDCFSTETIGTTFIIKLPKIPED
ncbi:MAG: hypothetical protein JXR48_17205 [Candidatus Delongbacteria bacterium]|nr:hypothetical protein [Candidatus Delongbacteria bacterium]MBN2836697.1 hypothetical protein [Candidatus Delongbacteria bacterium]